MTCGRGCVVEYRESKSVTFVDSNKLKDQQLSFYTYAENYVKTQIFVLKRHHYVTPDELLI